MAEEDKLMGFVDSAEQDPNIPPMKDTNKCPEHPTLEPEIGYGMAGGGMGPYMYCPECYRILGKDQDPEMENKEDD